MFFNAEKLTAGFSQVDLPPWNLQYRINFVVLAATLSGYAQIKSHRKKP